MKNKLLKGDFLEFTNSQNDLIELTFNKDKFQLWLNGSIIRSCKTFNIIKQQFNFLLTK